MDLSPLSFIPKLSPKIWGGRRLQAYCRGVSFQEKIGEAWCLYDRPGESALVAEGPFKGRNLNSLMMEYGPRLLGSREFDKRPAHFPLMVKLIDAHEALSIQVHPDDDQAARMVGAYEPGKTEMWVLMEAEAGAKVCAGLRPGLGRKDLEGAIKAGNFAPILNEFEVRPGDAIFLPAGRIHAIGQGCLLAEIQQNSDTTYRVWDYGRLENGKPRALHTGPALECARYEALPDLAQPQPRPIEGGRCETLVSCPQFKVERLMLQSRFRPDQGRDA